MTAPRTVYLIGFMGAGKTTVGKLLATQMSLPFVDQDELFFRQVGVTPAAFIANKGEHFFRQLESEILRSTPSGCVFATGGGCPVFNSNVSFMNASGITVYLRVPLAVLIARLTHHPGVRPLLHTDEPNWTEKLKRLLDYRIPYYSKAKYSVDIGEEDTVLGVAKSIQELL